MRAGFGHHRFLDRARDALKNHRRASTPLLAALALVCAMRDVAATPPPPPRRPSEFGKSPAPRQAGARKTRAANGAPARAPVDVDVNKLEPYNLPPASREKVHQCGDEWRKLKMAGKSEGLIWRSFAEKCFTR